MGVRDRLRRKPVERSPAERSLDQYLSFFSYGGLNYALTGGGSLQGTKEEIGSGLVGYATGGLKSNGVVFACMALRLRIFSDIRFGFREMSNDGRPGKLTGSLDGRNPASKGLRLLATPEPGLTTGDLLAHMISDVDLTGNAFVRRSGDTLKRLRPDWVTIVMGSQRPDSSAWDLDAELMGYLYQEGGPGLGRDPIALFPEEVAHWAPMPDPLSPRRGMSWLTPVLREIQADSAATTHKERFFANGATVNLVMEFPEGTSKDLYDSAVTAFNDGHQGEANAYKTLFLLGATAKTIGADFQQMDFKATQGAGETRIAAAAGVGPVLTFLSEGLQGSALNAGNFAAARRAVGDMTFRPLWRNLSGSLAHIIETPPNKELWYDEGDCKFLQEDAKDAAEIQQILANTIATLVKEGYEPDSVVDAVIAEDMTLLRHGGLLSVQLQKPGAAPNGKALALSPMEKG
jgi:hypothetical protein